MTTRRQGSVAAVSMYTLAYDKCKGLMVVVWSGTSNSVEDYDQLVADTAMADRDGADNPDGVVTIVQVDEGNPRPTPIERKRIIDAVNAAVHAPRHYFALVSTSTLARGVLTIVNWFSQHDPRRVNSYHASCERAVAWVESYRGGVSERLLELQGQARRRASRTSFPPASARTTLRVR